MNVRIRGIESYHPANVVGNEEFIKYYDKKGIDIREFMKSAGRDKRHLSNDPSENSLTMALESCKKVLKKCNMKSKDIDILVFASDTPEYLLPCNALLLHEQLGCRSNVGVHDINVNCLGLVTEIDLISKIMKSDKSINNALIVGAQQLQLYGNTPASSAIFGDSSCAIILEKTTDNNSYFIDSLCYTDTSLSSKTRMPNEGFSYTEGKMNLMWPTFFSDKAFYHAVDDINEILVRNGIEKKNVKKYFVSQMLKSLIDKLVIRLEETNDKFTYIGDEFGYTGVTSPFIAMQRSIELGEINRGDYVVIWSLAAGITERCILLRY